jgi:arabinogalactan endo-1,4-beta-galactosidase
VFLQFLVTSSLSQDTWLVAVKTNVQILYYVTGAQEICCNLKLCTLLINSSAFIQQHCAHIPICSHLWNHSFSSYYTVCDQALHLQNITHTQDILGVFCFITWHNNYAQCTTALILFQLKHAPPFYKSYTFLCTVYKTSNKICRKFN